MVAATGELCCHLLSWHWTHCSYIDDWRCPFIIARSVL